MKRAVMIIAAFVAAALITVAAQAEGREQVVQLKNGICHNITDKGGHSVPGLVAVSRK